MKNYIDELCKGWAIDRFGAVVINKISDSEIESTRIETMKFSSNVAAEYIKNGRTREEFSNEFSIKETFLKFLAVKNFPELL